MNRVTRILNTAGESDAGAANELLSLVYGELRRLATAKMASESPGQTLQPTALVHEAWLRLTGDEKRQWNDRTHFFAAAAEAMRRILVDNARRKRTERHGGGQQRVEMPEIASAVMETDDKVLAVNEALEKFAVLDPQKAELVKLRTNRKSAMSPATPSTLGPANGGATQYGKTDLPPSNQLRLFPTLGFSPDGRTLAVGNYLEARIQILRAPSFEEIAAAEAKPRDAVNR